MRSFSEEDMTGQLGQLADAEPRAEFVLALEETLVREARKMQQKRQVRKWTALGSGLAAVVVLAGVFVTPSGREMVQGAFGGATGQVTPIQNGPAPAAYQFPAAVPVQKNAELVYTEFDGQDDWLYFVDEQTLKVKKKVLLSHGGHGNKIYRDSLGRFWCPLNGTENNQNQIVRYDPKTDEVAQAEVYTPITDVFFTEHFTLVAGFDGRNWPMTYQIDEQMTVKGGLGAGGSGYEKPLFDGRYITYYQTEGPELEKPGIKPGYFKVLVGTNSMQVGIITKSDLLPNLVFQDPQGDLFFSLKNNPEQFVWIDRKLQEQGRLTWEDLQARHHQLSLLEPNQVNIAGEDYSILTVREGGASEGASTFLLVNSTVGNVIESFTADFLARISFANGKFYATGMVEPKMAIFDLKGKLEQEINTTGVRSNVLVK